jgi:glycosyltransferase involved in cell wall biosynthesis
MRIVFLHQNFPGQFLGIARALAAEGGHQLVAITDAGNKRPEFMPTVRYGFDAKPLDVVPPLSRPFSVSAARGARVAAALAELKNRGFAPDLVIGSIGWGETLFVRDVYPDVPVLAHAEFYYSATGSDVGFDPEFAEAERRTTSPLTVRARNAALLLGLNEATAAIAPTEWQASRFPAELRGKIHVAHEGIDTARVAPDPAASFTVPGGGPTFRAGDEVVTFVNRNLEPYRGYHVFMRALPAILAARPKAHAVLVGGESTSYGLKPANGTWKQIFLDEVKDRLDLARVHFTGQLPYGGYVQLLQVSAAHVYLTYPFVLSWSMLEAMSAGAPVIASATPPVTEVVEDGRTGLLFDFFDHQRLAKLTIAALDRPAPLADIRRTARAQIVERYDLAKVALPRWRALVGRVAGL